MTVLDVDDRGIEWIQNLALETYTHKLTTVEFGAMVINKVNAGRCLEVHLQELSAKLLRYGTMTYVPVRHMLACMVHLAKSGSLSWARLIKVICEFKDFSRTPCVEAIANIFRSSLFELRCREITDDQCATLAKAILDVLNWCFLALEHTLQVGDERTIAALARCASEYAKNKFVRAVLFLYGRISGDIPDYIVKSALNFAQRYPKNLDIDELQKTVALLYESPVEKIEESLIGMVKQPRPAVLTLVSVFEGFRMTKRVEQMADAFFEVVEILRFPYAQMFEDMLRASLLIMLDVKESVSEEMAAFQSFFYIKLPQIIKHLLQRGIPREDLLTALANVCENKILLNQVDTNTKSNTPNIMLYFLEQLCKAKVIEEDFAISLQERRLALIAVSCPPLSLILQQTINKAKPVIFDAETAKLAVDKIMKQSNDSMMNLLKTLAIGSSGLFTFDSVCASFSADGKLTYFSSKLATINGQSERPTSSSDRNEGYSRALAFNLSFILLTRIRFNYNDLRPSELVNGASRTVDNTRFCFYKFASNYGWTAADCCGQRSTLSVDAKAHYLERVNMLKRGQIFWDKRTVNYAELVDAVPLIGEILLDECRCKRQEDQEHFHEVIKKVLLAFCDETNFMIVCLVQWMCSQPVSEGRQNLVKSFIYALSVHPGEMQQERMALTSAACRRTLEDLLTCDRLRDPRFTWIINCAKRKLPAMPFTMPAATSQSSDAEMLKQAFTFARQQGWASPDVLQLVDRCNKAGVVENWCMVWLNSMFKLATNDEMVAAGELCFAAGVLSPVPCMITFAREITDYVLEQNVEFGCIEPKALVSANFLVHCLQLAYYSYWRLQKEKAQRAGKVEDFGKKKCRTGNDDGTSIDAEDPVERTMEVIFSKFLRETRAGRLKSTIVFIEHFLVALASAPRNEPTKRIIALLPQELMKNLAELDNRSFNFDLYMHLVDLADDKSVRSALQFTCFLRQLEGI